MRIFSVISTTFLQKQWIQPPMTQSRVNPFRLWLGMAFSLKKGNLILFFRTSTDQPDNAISLEQQKQAELTASIRYIIWKFNQTQAACRFQYQEAILNSFLANQPPSMPQIGQAGVAGPVTQPFIPLLTAPPKNLMASTTLSNPFASMNSLLNA
jgi:hypothetical protein